MSVLRPRLDDVERELRRRYSVEQEKHDGDEALAAFYGAAVKHLYRKEQTGRMLEAAIVNVRESRPFPSKHVVHFIFRRCQMEFMDDPEYPYTSEEQWLERIDEYLSNPMNLRDFSSDMQIWTVGSDVETRIAGPLLVAQTLQAEQVENPEDPYNFLVVGSARNHGLAMAYSNLEFPEVEQINPSEAMDFKSLVNELINKEIVLGDSYGIDIWPLNDIARSKFLKSCRFTPNELLDPAKRALYDELEIQRDLEPRIHHTTGDFAELSEPPSRGNNWLKGLITGEKYNAVVYSTSLYQNYDIKRAILLANGLKRLKQGGKIIVQDFCDLDRSQNPEDISTQLVFPDEKFAAKDSYELYVFDTDHPEFGFQHFLTWHDSRCDAFTAHEAFARATEKLN